MIDTFLFHRILNPEVRGSNRASLTKNEVFEKQHVRNMFSASENDPDLSLLIEKWSNISVELRKAIVKMVQ